VRDYVVKYFSTAIAPFSDSISSIGVIGGYLHEPELNVFREKRIKIKTIGIDTENDFFLDLNYPIPKNARKEIGMYDLILCSQVFEHLFDIKQAITNLYHLANVDGLIWIGFPSSNRAHGSPEYYSAGYQPELVTKLIQSMNLKMEILYTGVVGSKRYYFMNHALSVWPSTKELDKPILQYDFSRLPGPRYKDCLRFLRDVPGRAFATFVQNKVSDDVRWACESFVLARKN